MAIEILILFRIKSPSILTVFSQFCKDLKAMYG